VAFETSIRFSLLSVDIPNIRSRVCSASSGITGPGITNTVVGKSM